MWKNQTNWQDKSFKRELPMDITEFLFLTVVMVMLIEMFCRRFWISVYFRKGIPIFRKSFQYYREPCVSKNELLDDFNFYFLSLTFYYISDGEIAFRESWGIHPQIPILHGVIQIDNDTQKIIVRGYLSWFVLYLLCSFPLNILADPANSTHIFDMLRLFILAVIIIFVVLKFKYKWYEKILNFLKKKYS
jgi:hypothetical protein